MVVAIQSYQIAYMPVPKAACSSVKSALALIDPEVDVTLQDLKQSNKKTHSIYQTRRFRPHRWAEYKNWWRFTVVRDPLKRLLSVYTDRVVGKRELHNSPRLKKQDTFSLDPDPDFFFQNLKSYMSLSSVVKHHALPTRLFIGPKPLLYNDIYTIDRLPDLQCDLGERTGKDVVIPRHNSSLTTLHLTELKPKTQQALCELLTPEYEHLSEFFDSPF